MTKSIQKIALAFVLTLGTALSASAVTVTFSGNSTQGWGNTAGTAYGIGYGANDPIGSTWSSDPYIAAGNVSGQAQSPFNNTGLLATQDYFVVGGNGVPSPVSLTFDAAKSFFSLLWGSIDSYNTIAFFDAGNNLIEDYTGTEIVALGSLGGSPNNFEQVAVVNFGFGANELVKRVQFTSTNKAFEFALAPVPLPAGGLLLLTALGGLVVARRRQA